MTKASDNQFPSILFAESAPPSAPSTGYRRLFLNASNVNVIGSNSSVRALAWAGETSGSGDVATDAIWDAKGDLAVGTGANTAQKLTAGTNDYLLVAASGETTGLKWQRLPTFSGARVYHSTTQSVGASVTALSMNSEDFDTDSYHDNSTNNTRLTVPATGYYLITGHVQFDNTGTNILGIRIDGSTQVRGSAVSTASGQNKLQTTQIAYLTSGQYVELWAYQSGTANVGDTTYAENMNSFSILRLA
jgi:hypothetical protein